MAISIRKKLPIGLSDYKELILTNRYYVDKTLLISQIWDTSKVILMPRPHRFGKTLNLSMMRYFFEKGETDFERLFGNSKLLQQYPEYREFMGKYPVIFLTFKDVAKKTWAETYTGFKRLISEEFNRHRYLLESLNASRDKKLFLEFMEGESSSADLTDSLLFLSRVLSEYYQEQVIIILDEYDAPIHVGYDKNYYQEVIDFTRPLLSAAFKDNTFLLQGFISGILTIAKEGMFSGLNNLEILNILKQEANDSFGFTEDEVGDMLDYYQMGEHKDDFKAWYDGYRFGNQSNIYNPWSVINCIKGHGVLLSYWANTSTDSLIKKFLPMADESFQEKFELLLSGQEVEVSLNESIVMPLLDTKTELLWSLLFFAGYLTYSGFRLQEDTYKYTVYLPNKEIKKLFDQLITDLFVGALKSQSFDSFMHVLLRGDVDLLTDYMRELILSSMSSFDIPSKQTERSYHLFMLGLLVCLRDKYTVKSNRESGEGRYDIMLIPKQKNLTALIIEFKKSRSLQGLEEMADAGLKQIQDKKYAQELAERGIKRYRAYGMAFFGKSVFIKTEVYDVSLR